MCLRSLFFFLLIPFKTYTLIFLNIPRESPNYAKALTLFWVVLFPCLAYWQKVINFAIGENATFFNPIFLQKAFGPVDMPHPSNLMRVGVTRWLRGCPGSSLTSTTRARQCSAWYSPRCHSWIIILIHLTLLQGYTNATFHCDYNSLARWVRLREAQVQAGEGLKKSTSQDRHSAQAQRYRHRGYRGQAGGDAFECDHARKCLTRPPPPPPLPFFPFSCISDDSSMVPGRARISAPPPPPTSGIRGAAR